MELNIRGNAQRDCFRQIVREGRTTRSRLEENYADSKYGRRSIESLLNKLVGMGCVVCVDRRVAVVWNEQMRDAIEEFGDLELIKAWNQQVLPELRIEHQTQLDKLHVQIRGGGV